MSRRWAVDGRPLPGRADREGVRIRLVGEGGEVREWRILADDGSEALLEREGDLRRVTYARDGEEIWVHLDGRTWRLRAWVEGAAAGSGDARAVTAPMTGTLLTVLVETGEQVEAGQEVGILEAMKMQCELKAPRAGIIAEIRFQEGDAVPGGAVVVTFEAEDEA